MVFKLPFISILFEHFHRNNTPGSGPVSSELSNSPPLKTMIDLSRALEFESLSDVDIITRGNTIKAHKVILFCKC